MLFAAIVFVFSLLSIIGLFSFKHWEEKRGVVVLPQWRERADLRAIQLKELALAARTDVAKLPPEIIRVTHILIHEMALGIAALARFSERQAHRLADMVSHKQGFEKRETRSEFLKKVAEHKNGTENGLDTTGDNGHNI